MFPEISLCILLLISVTQATTEPPAPSLNYTCGTDAVASIYPDDIKKIRIIIDQSKNVYCQPTDSLMKNCFGTNKLTPKLPYPLQVLYEDELNPGIIGGQVVYFYKLTCTDGPRNVTAQALFNANKTKTYKEETKNTDLKDALHLQIANVDGKLIDQYTTVKIGDELSLSMTGPAGHSINPGNCTAYSIDMTNNAPMWTNTGNSTCNIYDKALIGQHWTGNQTNLSIKMYGFRFVGSTQVKIICAAVVCPEASHCVQYCVKNTKTGNNRRRRNAIITSKKEEKSASVTFRITAQEVSNTSAGITPSSVVCIVLMMVAVGWM